MSKIKNILVFDFETEGLNLITSRPWSLAYTFGPINKTPKTKKDLWIKWDDLRISAEAARVTGFSKKEYDKRALPPKTVFWEFSKLAGRDDTLVVGQNILNFDVFIYKVFAREIGEPFSYDFFARCFDIRAFALADLQNIELPKDVEIAGDDGECVAWQMSVISKRKKGLRSSTSALLKHYGIRFDESKLHDALYDTLMTQKIFNKLWYKYAV
jgi:DNA polymerase III epsilon subunit-like protein